MKGIKVLIEEKLKNTIWKLPEQIIMEPFNLPVKSEHIAIIVSFEKAKQLKAEIFAENRVIVDCVDICKDPERIREICEKNPFFIVLRKEERNLKTIFEKKGLKLSAISKDREIVYSSMKMDKLMKLTKKVAKTDVTVMIRGESGTGKELIARAIHTYSKRKDRNFVAVNCASIPETLLEAELFGHKKGAFTDAYTDRTGKFHQADRGTLFLDEIGDMPLSLQAKILRAIQEKEIVPLGSNKSIKIDVRIVSATAKNLEEMVKKGLFREDLYYRLNVVPIFIPPLRERKEDIEILFKHFLEKFSLKHSIPVPEIDKRAIEVLKEHKWKGNVRELENFTEKLLIFSGGEKIHENTVKEALNE